MIFELLHTDPGSSARAGLISTDHGTIETPIFMPVGTVGSVKGVFHRDLADEAGTRSFWAIPTICTCVRGPIF